MQRIINDPNMVVEDMLKGFAKCHRDIIHVAVSYTHLTLPTILLV